MCQISKTVENKRKWEKGGDLDYFLTFFQKKKGFFIALSKLSVRIEIK